MPRRGLCEAVRKLPSALAATSTASGWTLEGWLEGLLEQPGNNDDEEEKEEEEEEEEEEGTTSSSCAESSTPIACSGSGEMTAEGSHERRGGG